MDASDMPRVVTVLGVGQMAMVCAQLLAQSDRTEDRPEVRMWGHDPEESGLIAQSRRSDRLPDFVLSDNVRVCLGDAEALDSADFILNAIPVQFMRPTWRRLRPYVRPGVGVASVSKGIETESLLRPTQIIADVLEAGHGPLGALIGPSIAAELATCMPATLIAASDDGPFAAMLQRLFSTSWMRLYTNTDLVGVELAGATKNVIAIAAGVLDGLRAGCNAKSALLARGLAEIARLGSAMGADRDTFFGIAGVGDLATTCFSPHGRNRSCGEALGKGESLEHYLQRSACVVEGVATTKSVMALAERYDVEMPITRMVHAVLFEGMDPIAAIGRLMSRELKDERVG